MNQLLAMDTHRRETAPLFCVGRREQLPFTRQHVVEKFSVRYGAGRGGFSLCDPAVTPARGQLFAVPPRPV